MDSKVVNLSFIVLQCQLNMEKLTENSLRDILSTLFADGGGGVIYQDLPFNLKN